MIVIKFVVRLDQGIETAVHVLPTDCESYALTVSSPIPQI